MIDAGVFVDAVPISHKKLFFTVNGLTEKNQENLNTHSPVIGDTSYVSIGPLSGTT